ncbi:M56 family metallopeptidase [Pedobacter xixiisoli]|uniref:Outer membrane transport energization protein TonB n=1 Tax=Pedobacter xixiisoli TaxID=1476464 RepID=A0A286AE47_9SPHI|nr:M56 family metallopeptidase [Pedobacter xixiisoli]SOD20172.1 outer membrane transport energization protein TonB [Pedobacter xixiisoli]
MSWSHYLLQVNIYLVVFYAFYRLLLAKETYFVFNRIYLIGAGIFSLTIPFMQIEWFGKQAISQQIYVQVSQINDIITQPITAAPVQHGFNWGLLIAGIYLIGTFFFTVRFILQLYAVKKMLEGVKSGLAFSFWKQKVVAQNLPEVATVNHHEDIHIKQLHTFDVIFFEILGIITWFNPIIYLYKETVKSIHEYLADEAAAKFQGDKETYAILLLNQAFGVNTNKLTNGFFKKSMVKKRIFMLYKERSKKTAILKYGIFVPLFAAALLLSSATISKNEQILATAENIKLEDVKEVVAEVLELPSEKTVNISISPETKVKPPINKANTNDGTEGFYKFLGSNIKYPSTAAENNVQGNLIVSFTVTNKKLENIIVDPKLGYGADEEVSVNLAKYQGNALANGNYSMKVEYRLSGSPTKILNESIVAKTGYTALNTVTIIGYAKPDPENQIYSFISIENPPTYPGGMDKFYKFLSNNIKYPEEAKKLSIQGKVFVSFVVEKDGSLSDIKIDRKVGYGTDEEAVRVLKLSPKWNAGLKNGTAVRVKYNLPIAFTLNQKSVNQEAVQDNTVYSFVSMENPPQFPGGMTQFYKFLGDNIKYPEEAKKSAIQGKVFASFTIEKDGSLGDIKIDRKLGYGTDEEAIRVLKLSPKWIAGTQDGKPVRVKYNLPIGFVNNKG